MTSLSTDKLAELIRKKQQVLLQLRDIGLKQQALIDESATSQLLQLLGAKQHLIAALQLVERNLRPYQAEDPDARQWQSAEERQDCAARAEACNQLLGEVMQLERQQESKMTQRRDQTAEKLKRASSAHRAVGAYAQQGAPKRNETAPPTPHFPQPEASNSIDLTSGTT